MSTNTAITASFLIAAVAFVSCSSDDEIRQLATELCEQRSFCEEKTGRSYDQLYGLGDNDCVNTVEGKLHDAIEVEGVICRFAFEHWARCHRENDCQDFLSPGSCSREQGDFRAACGELASALTTDEEDEVKALCEREERCGSLGPNTYPNCPSDLSDLLEELSSNDPACYDATRRSISCLSMVDCDADALETCASEVMTHISKCDEVPRYLPSHPAAQEACSWHQSCRPGAMTLSEQDQCRAEYTALLLDEDSACHDASLDAIDCFSAQDCPLSGCDKKIQAMESACNGETLTYQPHWPIDNICDREAECGFSDTDEAYAECFDFYFEQIDEAVQDSSYCHRETISFYECTYQQFCFQNPFKTCRQKLSARASSCSSLSVSLPHPSAHILCKRDERCGFLEEPGGYEDCLQKFSENLAELEGTDCYDAVTPWYDCIGTAPCSATGDDYCPEEWEQADRYCIFGE